ALVFATALLVLMFIGFDPHLLPGVVTLPGVAFGLGASLLPGEPRAPGLWPALGAAVGGYVAFLLVAEAYRRTRGAEGLGMGDWKIAAMLGAFLGWQKLLLTVFEGAICGTMVRVRLMGLARLHSSR